MASRLGQDMTAAVPRSDLYVAGGLHALLQCGYCRNEAYVVLRCEMCHPPLELTARRAVCCTALCTFEVVCHLPVRIIPVL
jgi:hypothetical protein